MLPEPEYLKDLGELATLKNFFGAEYHQDAWDDFPRDEDRWQEYMARESEIGLARLKEQLNSLGQRSDEEIHDFIQQHADALYFEKPSETSAWLRTFMRWLEEH